MITLTFVADTPEELKKDILFFSQGNIKEVPGSVSIKEERSYTASASYQSDSDMKPEPVPAPEAKAEAPAKQAPEPKPEAAPEEKAAVTDGLITEAEAVELRVLAEKFCAADKDGKKKIKEFLGKHNVPRITALPRSLISAFREVLV